MAGPELYFCDVPVYRLPAERYYAERDAYVKAALHAAHQTASPSTVAFQEHLINVYGGCWNYNEIIGYIRLHFLGSQIRGEYFAIQVQRMVRTRRKVFKYQTHKLAPEVSIPVDATNAEIADSVREYVSDCQRELRGRFIHTEILDRISSYIDWRGLMGWNQSN